MNHTATIEKRAVLAGCLVPANVSLATFSGTNLLIFVGLGILCTAIPNFAFAFASERVPSVVTATVSLLILRFAGAFAFVTLGEVGGDDGLIAA
jgi:drug/metabolite transporter (DMT)-like permease